MTGEQWHTHYWRIYTDAVESGVDETEARDVAERECGEQFGPEPEEAP